jgi:hypothetical protein
MHRQSASAWRPSFYHYAGSNTYIGGAYRVLQTLDAYFEVWYIYGCRELLVTTGCRRQVGRGGCAGSGHRRNIQDVRRATIKF